eukprot:gene8019-5770_t
MIPPVYTKIATAYGEFALRQVPKVAKWGLPAAIFGVWMAFPALTPNFKKEIGLSK